MIRWTLLALLVLALSAYAKRQALEDVTRKQFESIVQQEDYFAVFWCKLH